MSKATTFVIGAWGVIFDQPESLEDGQSQLLGRGLGAVLTQLVLDGMGQRVELLQH